MIWHVFMQVTRQLSQLAVVDGQPPRGTTAAAAAAAVPSAGSGPAGSRRVARQPPPGAFVRRLSAPGPAGGAAGEPGSRKPWSYTPSFGRVGGATGRVAAVSSRPL